MIYIFLPVFVISYCYIKISKDLRTTLSNFIRDARDNANRLLWFPVVPIVCWCPEIVADVICMYYSTDYPDWLGFLISLIHRCWGLLNLLTYWLLTPKNDEKSQPASGTRILINEESEEY